ncbi:MAG: hypothetical protein ABIJ23_04610 [Candidatus Magasanikbacteria bacterium]
MEKIKVKLMKKKSLIVLITSILIVGTLSFVYAVPPLPYKTFGLVTIDGSLASDGTSVEAYIDGVQYASAIVRSGCIPEGCYILYIPGDDSSTPEKEGGVEGETVNFKVNGYDTDETGTWSSGVSDRINLTITTEFISITLLDYPINFGSLNPDTSNNLAQNNPYTIRVEDETTVNVDIYQKGDDFVKDLNSLDIINMKWYNESNLGSAFVMQTTYQNDSKISDIAPDTNVSAYYWLTIPPGQSAGTDYTSTIYIKAVEMGTSP